jgi:2,4-dienoyl-CoA reductase-like NADH-dependent reductase (Old Yellow Enzyme family)
MMTAVEATYAVGLDSEGVGLGSPLQLSGFRLRNRIVANAHATAAVYLGAPTAADAGYWSRLAAGGAAMVVTGATVVSPESTMRGRNLTEIFRPDIRPALSERARAIKSGGAVAIAQILHLGREMLGAEYHFAPVSASPVRSPREAVAPRALSAEDVTGVVDAFRISAANALAAGFDGVELHAAHGYLLAQFLSRVTNLRPDRYGQRAELLTEVIAAVRAEVGAAPIGVRVSVEGNSDSGLGLEDLVELLPLVSSQTPFDYLNLTGGVRNTYVPDMATTVPKLLDAGQTLRRLVHVPLLLSQSFRQADQMRHALSSGSADLVGVARALIADPDLPNKVLAGAEHTVRPCTACNEDCRTFEPSGMCSVNPDLAPAGSRRRPAAPILLSIAPRSGREAVAVVGGGPAGMECAMTLAAQGIATTLYELRSDTGGQARVAALAPNRAGWQRFLDFQRRQLNEAGVRIPLGEAPADDELAQYGDVVFAVGATERQVDLPGPLRSIAASEFLAAAHLSNGARVAVIDDGSGWWLGVSAVESALAGGASEVTLLTPGVGFAGGLSLELRTQMLHRLKGARLRVVPLNAAACTVSEGVVARSVLDDAESLIAADLVVAVGERVSVPLPSLGPGVSVCAIGDCVVPRRISHAVTEGRTAALMILDAARRR